MTDSASPGTSKIFDLLVGGASKLFVVETGSLTSAGNINSAASLQGINLVVTNIYATVDNTTLMINPRAYTAADNMVEMATGTATFTGFDGEIAGVVIMPTVGALDDGDIMTLLKLAPQGTPASTLGIMRGLAFGNWGGTGTDSAYMIDLTATGYNYMLYSTVFSVNNLGVMNLTVTNTTTTNAYIVGGGQAATTKNTGWASIQVAGAQAWIPYWTNATP